MDDGSISAEGFGELATAGRQGRWPRLKRFEIREITGDLFGVSKDLRRKICCSILHEVWPDLEVNIFGEGYWESDE